MCCYTSFLSFIALSLLLDIYPLHETVAKQALLATCLRFDPEDGGNSFLIIVGERLANCRMALHPRRQYFSRSLHLTRFYAILVLTHWSVFLDRAVLHSGEQFVY
jgi:hypothetical protein